MVVVDKPDNLNENMNVKGDVIKCQKELTFLNEGNDQAEGVEELTMCMKTLAVDQTDEVIQQFKRLDVQERRQEDDSEEEGVIHYGDHREEKEVYIGRGPPGVPVESQYYLAQASSSQVENIVSDIQRQKGGKRGHDEVMDPLSKGMKPNNASNINTVALNQLSGGSVKCTQGRHGRPTVKELLAKREQDQQMQQMLMHHLSQSQTLQQYPTATTHIPIQQQISQSIIGLNIPTDDLNEDEGLFDIDAFLETVEEAEKMTSSYPDPTPNSLPPNPAQIVPTTETVLQHESFRRIRNPSSMSDVSPDPRSPESGYHTSSPAPSSPPRSPPSRPSSFGEENKLAKDLEETWNILEEFLEEKANEDVKRKLSNKMPQSNVPKPTFLQNPPQQVAAQMPMPPAAQPMFIPPAVQQAAPTCNAPLFVVGVPNIIPAQLPLAPAPTPGKGRPPNSSKVRQSGPVRHRVLLPKPDPCQAGAPTIPTTVAVSSTTLGVPSVTSVAQGVVRGPVSKPTGEVVYQQQQQVKAEPMKFTPIAPKKDDFKMTQRGDVLMKRTMPDVLTDTKMKIRAHRQIVGKPIEEILKVDADGDMWLHSYIMYVNENKDSLYMINAIIQRLKREHKESNINIKKVINTQNNIHQTPAYLATVMNNQYVLDWILKAGGDPNIMASSNAPSGMVRKGPLHYAASRGDECLDVLYTLLECREIDVNLKNTDGLSPLHVAVKSHGKPIPNSTQEINSTRVILALIQRGANLEEVDDKNGKTPIHNLVECQSFELVSEIFNVIPETELKKYLRKTDYQRNTSLHTAAQSTMSNKDDHKKIIKLLLDKGADPSMKNAENQTASMLAYKPHKEELTPLLKPSHGKSIQNAMSPQSSQQPKKIAVTTTSTQPTFFVVGTLPAVTTQMVPVQTIGQPIQSQQSFVTVPQNAVLTTHTVNCGNPVTYAQIPQRPQQVMLQKACTPSVASPSMVPIGSPQMAQSPPHVQSPQMLQAHHDMLMNSPRGPVSPPQHPISTLAPAQQTNGNVYNYGNSVH